MIINGYKHITRKGILSAELNVESRREGFCGVVTMQFSEYGGDICYEDNKKIVTEFTASVPLPGQLNKVIFDGYWNWTRQNY